MPQWTRSSTSDTAAQPKGKASIGTSSAELLAPNRKRIAAYITNGGASRVWLALGPVAAKEEGILLNPDGGVAVIDNYKIVWANPRTQSERYRPEVGGMAAAWPYCDAVVSAHSLDALDDLLAALR